MSNFTKSFAIYRANNNGTGTAAQFQLSIKDQEKNPVMVFLVLAKQGENNQNGDAIFSWKSDTTLTVKLGEPDIGEFLAVLSGRKDSAGFNGKGLFHQSAAGNKVVTFNYNSEKGSYYLGVSAQDNEKNSLGKLAVVLGHSDAEILSILLKKSILNIFGW